MTPNKTAPTDFSSIQVPRLYAHTHPALERIAGKGAAIDTLTPAQTERLQRYVVQAIPLHMAGDLERFIALLFTDAEVVRAYFRPTPMPAGAAGQGLMPYMLPFTLAARAADAAHTGALLRPHERSLAWTAALIRPYGLFAAAAPDLAHTGNGTATRELPGQLLRQAVGDPLRRLRAVKPALADTLGAVLGLGGGDRVDEEQVSRIATAVTLACMRITRIWMWPGVDSHDSH